MSSVMHHRARKRFGQNFLRDTGVIGRIVHEAIDPRPGERLVEIGPGQGALTEPLLDAADSLEVIELDRDLIPGLRVQFFNYPNFVIHEGDALKYDFASLRGEGVALRVVGNLPYNISTPLIIHLLGAGSAVADMHFMLQKEVVERMAAEPGGSDWGRLSVMAQYYCQVEQLFTVPPEAFVPSPAVESAIAPDAPRRAAPRGRRSDAAVRAGQAGVRPAAQNAAQQSQGPGQRRDSGGPRDRPASPPANPQRGRVCPLGQRCGRK